MKIELTTEGLGLQLDQPPYDTEGLTCFITGNKGSGKSNTMAVMAEEAHANQTPFIFFDPNGDAVSLRQLGDDVIVIGNTEHEEPLRRANFSLDVVEKEIRDFVRMALVDGYSLVFDLNDYGLHDNPLAIFTAMANEHYRQAGRRREPCFLFVDEAHCFAPQSGANRTEQESRRALSKVASDGRKRGMLLVTATQRATYIHKSIIFGANVRLFGKITYFPDFKEIRNYVPLGFSQMKGLRSGEVVVTASGNFGKVQIKRRRTTDLGKTPAFKKRVQQDRPSIKQLQLL